MLVRLFGSNFRSFKDPFELSMVAADLKRDEDKNRGVIVASIKGLDEPLRLMRVVAVFGANASGKSTLLYAGSALRWLVTSSSSQSKPDEKLPPYEPFVLDDASRSAPITIGCDIVHDSAFLRYEIKYDANAILEESLSILVDDGEVKLIDRQPTGEVRGKLISGKANPNRLYVKEMQPNVAVLSKLAMFGPSKGKQSAKPYYRAIRNAIRFADYSVAAADKIMTNGPEDERFADDVEYREWIMRHLIQAADVGICDVQTSHEDIHIQDLLKDLAKLDDRIKLPEKNVVVSFVHAGNSNQIIDFSDESSGTKKLFNIAGDWWRLAKEPVTLFADELSASLHPRLLDRLIRSVNEAPPERVRSQLIFTTHDTGLLESQDGRPPALRRDQVYFTKKDARGVSELYSLAEFKEDARPVHNIRKRYLSGLYGAIPAIDEFSL